MGQQKSNVSRTWAEWDAVLNANTKMREALEKIIALQGAGVPPQTAFITALKAAKEALGV